MLRFSSCQLMVCAILASLPAHGQLQGGSLEGSGGLKGDGGRGLKGGSLQTSRIQGGRLTPSSLKSSKLEGSEPQRGAGRLNPAAIKLKAAKLAEGGLGVEKIQGAVSTIPRSQVGALLYDVAGILSHMGKDMAEVAVGYYMAVLADPEGERHDDALKRLREILLDRKLEHDEAVRLYDGGLETMKSLVDIKIGLTDQGYRAGLLTLQEVKAAYQARRKREQPEEEVALKESPKTQEEVRP